MGVEHRRPASTRHQHFINTSHSTFPLDFSIHLTGLLVQYTGLRKGELREVTHIYIISRELKNKKILQNDFKAFSFRGLFDSAPADVFHGCSKECTFLRNDISMIRDPEVGYLTERV